MVSSLAYVLTTAAVILTLFWYGSDRLLWFGAGTFAFLVLTCAVYMRRSRFVVVHIAHALIVLLVQALVLRLIPMALDLAFLLSVLTLTSARHAVQGKVMNWWLLNVLKRWLMPPKPIYRYR
jgi:hypothetical protein